MATSAAFRGRADGPDRLILGRFTKNPLKFSEINPHSRRSLRIFYKKHLVLFSNQRSVQNGWALVCLQKRPPLYRKSTRAPETLSAIFAKTSSDFSQIKIQPNFDSIFFSSKNTCGLGAPEKLVRIQAAPSVCLRGDDFVLRMCGG